MLYRLATLAQCRNETSSQFIYPTHGSHVSARHHRCAGGAPCRL